MYYEICVMNKKGFSFILMTALFAAVLSSCRKDDPPTYAVTFDSKGGTPTPATQIVKRGGTVEKPADPTLTHHQFAGWTKADNATSSLWNFAKGTVAADMTLYAKWVLNGYTVSFDGNGHTGGAVPNPATEPHGSTISLPEPGTMIKANYTFNGWNTSHDGAGTQYAAGDSYTVSGDTTLYATWELNSYTVSFNGNGHTGGAVPDPVTELCGNSIPLPEPGTMIKADYTFNGWNTSSDGIGTQYAAGDSYAVSGDMTLYANWIRNIISIPNPVKNPSVEDAQNTATPQFWSSNSWSVPANAFTSTFTYLNEGHTGARSVKVEITGYGTGTEGDAKWCFDHVQLEPGKDYVFSDWYKSNVDTKITVEYITKDGAYEYFDLQGAPPCADWMKYEAAFTMPENAKDGVNATVYHLLSQNGWLITDDYQLDLYYYEGFNRGMVTITFDDAWELNKDTAIPIMSDYGFKSNQFQATQYIMNPWPGLNPLAIFRQFISDGHEIGSHSVTHPDLTILSAQEVTKELVDSKNYLNNYLGVNVRYFATPFGAYNTFVKNEIMKHYDAHLTVDEGYNSKDNLDVSRLKRMSVLSTTTAAEVQEWVRKAKDEKLWLILLYHMVTDDPAHGENIYDHTSVSLFTAQMQEIYNSGIQVKTMSEALAEIRNQ